MAEGVRKAVSWAVCSRIMGPMGSQARDLQVRIRMGRKILPTLALFIHWVMRKGITKKAAPMT